MIVLPNQATNFPPLIVILALILSCPVARGLSVSLPFARTSGDLCPRLLGLTPVFPGSCSFSLLRERVDVPDVLA